MIEGENWEDIVLSKTMKSFYETYNAAYVQKTSFDNFLHHRIKKIIEEESVINVNISENEKPSPFMQEFCKCEEAMH